MPPLASAPNIMKFATHKPLAKIAALAAVLALTATTSFAATFNWTNTATTGLWSTALNWSGNTVPTNGPGDAVNLNANFTAATLITLDTSAIVGTMIYGDSSGTSPLSFTNSGGSTLTFDNNGSASTLTFVGATTPNFNVPILLANNLYISGTSMAPTFNGTISASTSGLKTITNSLTSTTYAAAISDGSGQVALYQDNGTVILSASNSFSGGVIFRRGTLTLGNSNALGTGTLLLTNTASITLSVTTNMIVTNKITLGAAIVGGGTNGLTLSGPVTLTGSSTLNRVGTTDIIGNVYLSDSSSSGRTLTIGDANNGSGSISGIIANYNGVGGTAGGIVKKGTGTWILSGANTYTGGTTNGSAGGTDAGLLQIQGPDGKIGGGQITIYSGKMDLTGTTQTITSGIQLGGGASGTTSTLDLGSGGSLSIGGTITYSASNNPNGGTISGGTINLVGNRIFNVGDSSGASVDLTVSSVVANGDATARTVRKQGAGVLVFSGANTYSGTTTVEAGVLNIQNATALGSTDAGTTVNSGTALQIQGGITVGAEALALNGTGISSDGALRNISGDNTYGGTITNTTAARINSDSGTLTLSGNINATNQAITFGGAGNIVANGAITNSTAGLTKDGAGTLTLSGSNANTYSGTTTVSAGVLELNKTGVEAIVGGITVGSGTTDASVKLLISSAGQVKDTSAITLSGGTITRAGSVSEVFGNLNLTTASFLDFGTTAGGSLTFGTYTGSSLLTVQNFIPGDTLIFKSDLSGSISNTSYFQFSGGFSSSWNSGSSTFTITAIPEASTVAAAIGLAGMMLWPMRRRLGLRASVTASKK